MIRVWTLLLCLKSGLPSNPELLDKEYMSNDVYYGRYGRPSFCSLGVFLSFSSKFIKSSKFFHTW